MELPNNLSSSTRSLGSLRSTLTRKGSLADSALISVLLQEEELMYSYSEDETNPLYNCGGSTENVPDASESSNLQNIAQKKRHLYHSLKNEVQELINKIREKHNDIKEQKTEDNCEDQQNLSIEHVTNRDDARPTQTVFNTNFKSWYIENVVRKQDTARQERQIKEYHPSKKHINDCDKKNVHPTQLVLNTDFKSWYIENVDSTEF